MVSRDEQKRSAYKVLFKQYHQDMWKPCNEAFFECIILVISSAVVWKEKKKWLNDWSNIWRNYTACLVVVEWFETNIFRIRSSTRDLGAWSRSRTRWDAASSLLSLMDYFGKKLVRW